jgi:hypothetical protein
MHEESQPMDRVSGSHNGRRDRPRNRRDSAERGAVVVEFALIAPLLILLVLGVATAGITYSRANGLSNAVREGARFGATADASAPVAAAWADNVISSVRGSQFDDPASETSVCVQIWRVGVGPIANTSKCSLPPGAPTLSAPTTAAARPAVPSGATGCVVRIIASRRLIIDTGFKRMRPVYVAASVSRYERKDKVSECK